MFRRIFALLFVLSLMAPAPVFAQETIFLPVVASGVAGPSVQAAEDGNDSAFTDNETSVATVNSASYQGSGAVYAMTNAAAGNEIAMYDRAANGLLTLVGNVPTGGTGITLVAGDALGSQASLILNRNGGRLFAVNAGSNEISSFKVTNNGLNLKDKVHSNGQVPVSLTIHDNLLYVLNAGGDGNITGFRIKNNGRLQPINNSTRSLNAGGTNPPFFLESPAQVGFSPDGKFLAVTIKGSNRILVYRVRPNGRLSDQPVTTISNGNTPFGFTFGGVGQGRRSQLFVVEAFGSQPVGTGNAGAVTSYRLERGQGNGGSLWPISGTVSNGQTATCWTAITSGPNRYLYTTNNLSDTITGYSVNNAGEISLLNADGVTATTGFEPVDLGISPDNNYLYNVDAGDGTISMFQINGDGSLTSLGAPVGGLPTSSPVGIAIR